MKRYCSSYSCTLLLLLFAPAAAEQLANESMSFASYLANPNPKRRKAERCWYERRLIRPPHRARRAIEEPASASSSAPRPSTRRESRSTRGPGGAACAWALLCIATDQFGHRGAALAPPEHPKPRWRWHCSERQIAAASAPAPHPGPNNCLAGAQPRLQNTGTPNQIN